jgi:tRNA1Val (adenine37-N6)-methyltransferase
MTRPFRFKQFTIRQDRAAMKVGTDGVLLGSWIDIPDSAERILDIGTGTGLIALMLAQRCPDAIIDAVEIDKEAALDATENFGRSLWSDRLHCHPVSIQNFIEQCTHRFNLIASNPPYFDQGLSASSVNRTMARQKVALDHSALLGACEQLLSEKGKAAFILPSNAEEQFLEAARPIGLLPNRITRVRGREGVAVKRVLLSMTRDQSEIVENDLVLEEERHVYTPQFREMVLDFYLNT